MKASSVLRGLLSRKGRSSIVGAMMFSQIWILWFDEVVEFPGQSARLLFTLVGMGTLSRIF